MPDNPETPAAFGGKDGSNPVAAFDLDAWRSGKKTPRMVVPVTNDPGAGTRLAELESREEQIRVEAEEAAALGKPVKGKRAGSKSSPELDALIGEMKAILADLDGSWMYVHMRALTPRESNRVSDKAERDEKRGLQDVRVQYVAEVMEIAATLSATREQPGEALSVEQWHDVLDTIGVAQTLRLERAVTDLSSKAVSPDFSRRISALLEEAASSSS